MYLSVCLVLLAIFSSVSSSSSNWTISLMDRTDRKSTRLNSSHSQISYAVFCLKKTAEYTLAGVPAPGGKPLCTVRLTRRLVPELRHRGLYHVAAFFGIDNPARHRAFGDALSTP